MPPLRGLKDLPSIRQLRAFVAVYRSGNLSAAAEMLALTQPAVTVLIREFEDKLGVRLFERTTRRLSRTDAAVAAMVHAERVLAHLDALGRDMADFAGSQRGRLRLAATPTVSQTVLPPLLKAFLQRHPQVKVQIDDCAPGEFVERIVGEQVDCGIGTLEAPIPGLREQTFLRDRIVAVAPAQNGFQAGVAMTWSELQRHALITVKPGYGVRRQIDRAALLAGAVLQVEHEVTLLATALALAAGGLGVAVVPGLVLERTPYPTLVARPLIEPEVTRDTAVVCKHQRALAPAALAFIDLLAELTPPQLRPPTPATGDS